MYMYMNVQTSHFEVGIENNNKKTARDYNTF